MHHPAIASWTDRVLSFVLDAVVIAIGLTIFFALVEALEFPSLRALAAAGAAFYLVYHAAALRMPRFSFGRTVTGISVISADGADLTLLQAVLRPAVRVATVAVAALIGEQIDVPWLMAAPLLADASLVAVLPRRASLGDLFAGTVVVAVPPRRRSPAPAPALADLDEAGVEAGS